LKADGIPVRMVRNEDEEAGNRGRFGRKPLPRALENLILNQDPPRFSGRDSDWKGFSRDWAQYLRRIERAMPEPIESHCALELLRGSLDRGSQDRLECAQEQDPELTYEQFWKFLCQEYEQDRTDDFRSDWERVTIRHEPRLTVAVWRNFRAAFDKARSRAPDVTDREAERKIEGELPPTLRTNLNMEKLRREQTEFLVRIAGPLPDTAHATADWMARCLCRPSMDYMEDEDGVVISCPTLAIKQDALATRRVGMERQPHAGRDACSPHDVRRNFCVRTVVPKAPGKGG
jgi:hypothetical protein